MSKRPETVRLVIPLRSNGGSGGTFVGHDAGAQIRSLTCGRVEEYRARKGDQAWRKAHGLEVSTLRRGAGRQARWTAGTEERAGSWPTRESGNSSAGIKPGRRSVERSKLYASLFFFALALVVLGFWLTGVTLTEMLQGLLALGIACAVTACVHGLAE